MKAVVRKGYIVMHNMRRFVGGEEIPPSLIPIIQANQSWKIEVKEDGKQKEESNTNRENKEEGQPKEEETLKDISIDRMMTETKVKKRG